MSLDNPTTEQEKYNLNKDLTFEDINPIWAKILEEYNYDLPFGEIYGERNGELIKLTNPNACIVGGCFGFRHGGTDDYKLPNGKICFTCGFFSMKRFVGHGRTNIKNTLVSFMEHWNKEHKICP